MYVFTIIFYFVATFDYLLQDQVTYSLQNRPRGDKDKRKGRKKREEREEEQVIEREEDYHLRIIMHKGFIARLIAI